MVHKQNYFKAFKNQHKPLITTNKKLFNNFNRKEINIEYSVMLKKWLKN